MPRLQPNDYLYFDTETCGFHGVPVTLQFAKGAGDISIYDLWEANVSDTLNFLERIAAHKVVGFNLAFDWFHVQKFYNILTLFRQRVGNKCPEDYIDAIGEMEGEARDGLCIKPLSAVDLMLHFKKTELQITMPRDDVYIRRVPNEIAELLARHLTKRVKLDPLLFAAQKKWAPRFKVEDIVDKDTGDINPRLKNVVLRFRPSGGLKALATHVLGLETTAFQSIEVDKAFRPKEFGYAPFATAVGRTGRWNWAWPEVIKYHIDHWRYNAEARKYANNDVHFTRELHRHTDFVECGDMDSVLACAVASCRWKGYAVNTLKLEELKKTYFDRMKAPRSPNEVKHYVGATLNTFEKAAAFHNGTGKKALKDIIECFKDNKPEVATKAKEVLESRKAKKKIEVLDKLIKAGRFHVSCKVIGAVSGRMSGTDGLNPQGIDKTKEMRGCFPLAFTNEKLRGGDMMSFEIAIAEAVLKDPELRRLLTTCEKCDIQMGVVKSKVTCSQCGGNDAKSFHALFGMGFYKKTYEEIMASKGTDNNLYNPSKNGGFASLYGAMAQKLADTMGIPLQDAIDGLAAFWRRFFVAGEAKRTLEKAHTSLVSSGFNSPITFQRPADWVESLTGYKRYFVLENYILKELYELATDIPKPWRKIRGYITRTGAKGEQTVVSAVRSALFGCAFSLQNSAIRQAANHQIQSTGAIITKDVQSNIWGLQPSGVSEWMVRPMNVHDELQVPCHDSVALKIDEIVYKTVESYREMVPLIGIDFGELTSWVDK